MSFFSKLYAYKQSPARGAFEDFLTELLAQWLRLADESGYSARALVGLFKLPIDRVPACPITWTTQHIIPKGYGKASRRKPDLVASAPGFLLLVENKVSAGFTSHYDEESGDETPQLDLYQSYLRMRADRGFNEVGGLCLLTFATPPPVGWNGPVCFWSEVHHLLRSDLAERRIDPASAFGYLTREMIAFVEDYGMGSIDLREADILALPAMRRLETAFGQLNALAVREATGVLRIPQAGVVLTPCGAKVRERGDFRAPWFYGEVLTKDGAPFDATAFVAWAGVMTTCVDWIIPIDEDVPEITVGLAVWCDMPSFDGPDERVLDAFEAEVSRLCQGSWTWQRLGRTEDGPVMIFSARVPLTEAWNAAQAMSWDDWASSYFRTHLSALFIALNTQYEGAPFSLVLDQWVHHP